jgi:2,3-diaminopropionate biosynthesis protein SbnA
MHDDVATLLRRERLIDDAFITLERDGRRPSVHVKLEGLNIAGSIKLKTALGMLADLECCGMLDPKPRAIIESSSGNLGVALSIACKQRGLHFICVTDPNASAQHVSLMKAYGAEVVIVTERDDNGGFLKSRIDYIEREICRFPDLLWTNQYANPACKDVHKVLTGPAIISTYPDIEYLFVGAGTTGTLMGCCEYFRHVSPATKVIGVDSLGSITFGGAPGRRYLPGLGASRCPELYNALLPHDTVLVSERETVEMCRRLRDRFGVLFGASTGTVIAGIERKSDQLRQGSRIVAISPDFGDRYIENVYNDAWVLNKYPDVLRGVSEAVSM